MQVTNAQPPPMGGPQGQFQGYTPQAMDPMSQVAYPQGGGGMTPMEQRYGAQQAQVAQQMGGMSDAQMHPYAPRNQGVSFNLPPPPDAAMHPFAPRNRPQFPGAMQGGIMGGMAPGMTPPWMRRQYQGL
jgi:hypothetical protein